MATARPPATIAHEPSSIEKMMASTMTMPVAMDMPIEALRPRPYSWAAWLGTGVVSGGALRPELYVASRGRNASTTVHRPRTTTQIFAGSRSNPTSMRPTIARTPPTIVGMTTSSRATFSSGYRAAATSAIASPANTIDMRAGSIGIVRPATKAERVATIPSVHECHERSERCSAQTVPKSRSVMTPATAGTMMGA